MSTPDETPVPAVEDEDAAHPVATAWRPVLRAIVRAFANEDYALRQPPPGVVPPSSTSDSKSTRSMSRRSADTWRISNTTCCRILRDFALRKPGAGAD